MGTHPVAEELAAVVRDLPPERQQQLLELARSWRRPETKRVSTPTSPGSKGPLIERNGLLLVSARLDGPFVDHRAIREEYLNAIQEPME